MPSELFERLVVRLPVDKYPVVLLRPEVVTVHVFFRHIGLGGHGRAPYPTVRKFPEEFLVRELRTRMHDERRLSDLLRSRRRAGNQILLKRHLFLLLFGFTLFVRHIVSFLYACAR